MSPQDKNAANERLDDAIRVALEARGHKIPVIVESISIVAAASFDDEGTAQTGVYYVTSGDGVPHYRLLGLIDFVRTQLRNDILTPDEE